MEIEEEKNKENSEENSNIDTSPNIKLYEIGYLLVSTISEEEAQIQAEAIKKLIDSNNGKVDNGEAPKMRDLAYPISKVISNKKNTFENAYFGWIKFNMLPADVVTFKESCDKVAQIIRFIIINAVVDSEQQKKIFKPRTPSTLKKKEVGEAMPVDEVALEKELEEILTE